MIRVFIVDDHHLFRAGVRSELEALVDIVGEASEVDAAIEMILERVPEVVLLDVHMPGGGGRTVIENVAPTHPDVKFLALSVSDSPEDVIAVVRAGARGYVTKTIDTGELAEAISTVAAGEAVFSPRLAGFVLDAFADRLPADHDPELDQLSPRERDVMRLIALGHTYKECAVRLDISVKTIERHMTAVLRKLQLSNRHELARWAADRRIV
jgi:DNA-binding NarL/FixJ family response regulator